MSNLVLTGFVKDEKSDVIGYMFVANEDTDVFKMGIRRLVLKGDNVTLGVQDMFATMSMPEHSVCKSKSGKDIYVADGVKLLYINEEGNKSEIRDLHVVDSSVSSNSDMISYLKANRG